MDRRNRDVERYGSPEDQARMRSRSGQTTREERRELSHAKARAAISDILQNACEGKESPFGQWCGFTSGEWRWLEGYADPGYPDCPHGLILANWNSEPMVKLERICEKVGIETDWSESYLTCDCGKAFRTDPDCMSWLMYGYIGDGDYACGDCVGEDPSDYFESVCDDFRETPVNTRLSDPADHGWTLLAETERGYRTLDETRELFKSLTECTFDSGEVLFSETKVWACADSLEDKNIPHIRQLIEGVYTYNGWDIPEGIASAIVPEFTGEITLTHWTLPVRCPACRDHLGAGPEVGSCESCKTAHHTDCLREIGCASLNCKPVGVTA